MSSDHRALATRLHFAAIHLLRRLRHADDDLGLRAADLSALTTLVNHGAMTLGELAAAEQVRPPTVSRLVQRLEADGYVVRRRSTEDGRVTRVRHTTKGWTTLEQAAAGRATALADALDDLDPDDVATLERGVELIEALARHDTERPAAVL